MDGTPTERPPITTLLERAHRGDRGALDQVARLVQGDLTRMAGRMLARRRAGGRASITLDPTALVNETFLKLLQQRKRWVDREHFFAIATRVMLRVLADYDRARRRRKREAARVYLSLGGLAAEGGASVIEVADVKSALEDLEATEPRAARVARLRLLWGLDHDEVACVLAVSRSTVDRSWRFARQWLAARL